MLPFYNDLNRSNKSIYINPNFKGHLSTTETSLQSSSIIPRNAHINPLFLGVREYGSTIHMNPAFLQKFQQQEIVQKNIIDNESKCGLTQQSTDESDPNISLKRSFTTDNRKIICKSKNRIIREPVNENADQPLKIAKPSFTLQPLLVLSKRKLIRKVPIVFGKRISEKKDIDESNIRTTKYKLDNRVIRKKPLLPPTPRIRRTSYIGRYALKRSLDGISNTKPSLSNNKNKNRKLRVLNINGLLYKSTQNSLKLKDITPSRILNPAKQDTSEKLSSTNQGLIIFVRGEKFVMDANKFKLTRVPNCDHTSSNYIRSRNSLKAPTFKRIDIGGYTYVSNNATKNVLIRTTNHLSRAYVHNAKQKSLQMLTKRLVKTNIPCPIFQRIGKCAAFERGKCSKAHNKLQVAICSKFLHGECLNSNCLLSHNVSLSKMPVCKFFLQGVCVRNDCHYLHKKLSKSAELCADFLRGFCQMADKCNKRHEFVCPEVERNNICTTKNCVYCNAKKARKPQLERKLEKLKNRKSSTSVLCSTDSTAEVRESQSCKRYFIDSSSIKNMDKTNENNLEIINEVAIHNIDDTEYMEESVDNSRKSRPKLGSLPAYIPL